MTRSAATNLSGILDKTLSDYVPTSTDLEAWSTFEATLAGGVVVLEMGLFSNDLSDFLENCAAAADKCNVDKFANFTGWAQGAIVTSKVDLTGGYFLLSFPFYPDQYRLVGLPWEPASNIGIWSGFCDE